MSDGTQIQFEPRGEGTLIAFYKQVAAGLAPASRHLLNVLARSVAERGWLQPISSLVELQVETGDTEEQVRGAVADLVHRRLLDLDDDGERVVGLLGSISTARTPHRGHLENGVDIFTHGGVELMSLASMFVRKVDAFSRCGQCEAEVEIEVDGDMITKVAPSGIAGFQASWDGSSPLAEAGARSPLFCSDVCLSAWQDAHPGVDGLPLASDTLLFIGMMMANESGGARFEMVRVDG